MRRRSLFLFRAFLPLALVTGCLLPGAAVAVVLLWGDDSQGLTELPNASYEICAVSPRDWCVMGLRFSGALTRWGHTCGGVPPGDDFIAVANGGGHSLALKFDGSIMAWGGNEYGELDVPEPNTGFVAIDAKFFHSIALRADGTVAAWGRNDYGQSDVPEPNTGFVAVAAGAAHSVGLRIDGSIVAWGRNTDGQCDVPAPNTGYAAVSAGDSHNLAIRTDGTVVAWGRNTRGQSNPPPEPNADFVAVSAGNTHSLALRSAGTVAAWGWNNWGECDVPTGVPIAAIAAGPTYSVGLVLWGLGACCYPNGSCQMRTLDMCPSAAIWSGVNTTCVPRPCDVADTPPEPVLASRVHCSPNPSPGPVTIRFGPLPPSSAPALVRICDAAGRTVRTFGTSAGSTDRSTLLWDRTDAQGRPVPSGCYFVQVIHDGTEQTGSLVLLR